MRLKDCAAIVTGAASGIGRATAALFAEEGAQVIGVDMPGRMPTADGNARIFGIEKDLMDPDAADAIVDAAISAFGRLDIVMNNAGVAFNATAETITDEVWDKTLSVNLTAQMRLCRKAIPHLKQSPAGRIINVASVMAEGTDFGLSAYCASKAGVAGLTRTLALELGRSGITAHYLEPGAIATGMTTSLWDARPDIAEIWAKKSALRRLGQPIDIARGAL